MTNQIRCLLLLMLTISVSGQCYGSCEVSAKRYGGTRRRRAYYTTTVWNPPPNQCNTWNYCRRSCESCSYCGQCGYGNYNSCTLQSGYFDSDCTFFDPPAPMSPVCEYYKSLEIKMGSDFQPPCNGGQCAAPTHNNSPDNFYYSDHSTFAGKAGYLTAGYGIHEIKCDCANSGYRGQQCQIPLSCTCANGTPRNSGSPTLSYLALVRHPDYHCTGKDGNGERTRSSVEVKCTGQENCAWCNEGYSLNSTDGCQSDTCIANKPNNCTCSNGTPTVATGSGGTLCGVDGQEDCSACNPGYAISALPAAGSAQTCAACAPGKEARPEQLWECVFVDCLNGNTHKCRDPTTGTCGGIGAVNCQGKCVNQHNPGFSTGLCRTMYSSFKLDTSDNYGVCAEAGHRETCVSWRGPLQNGFTLDQVQSLPLQDDEFCNNTKAIYKDNTVKSADCRAKTCTCSNGTPAVATGSGGTLCGVDGQEDCSACTTGYTISAPPAAGSAQTCHSADT